MVGRKVQEQQLKKGTKRQPEDDAADNDARSIVGSQFGGETIGLAVSTAKAKAKARSNHPRAKASGSNMEVKMPAVGDVAMCFVCKRNSEDLLRLLLMNYLMDQLINALIT